MIRLVHHEHGYHIPCFESEIPALQRAGWKLEGEKTDGVQKEEAAIALNEARSKWEKVFGMKPHHMKKTANLLKEIEAHGNRT